MAAKDDVAREALREVGRMLVAGAGKQTIFEYVSDTLATIDLPPKVRKKVMKKLKTEILESEKTPKFPIYGHS